MRKRMCCTVTLALVLMFGGVFGPREARGTSYNPLTPDGGTVATMTQGATTFLFHSGTDETRRAVRAGDVLVVRRVLPSGRCEAVGAVRVEAVVGARCFRGLVLEGVLQPDDVALAGAVSLLVLPSDGPCLDADGR